MLELFDNMYSISVDLTLKRKNSKYCNSAQRLVKNVKSVMSLITLTLYRVDCELKLDPALPVRVVFLIGWSLMEEQY